MPNDWKWERQFTCSTVVVSAVLASCEFNEHVWATCSPHVKCHVDEIY